MALTLDYPGALEALEALEGRGMKLGLERIEALLAALGNPHKGLRGALVAGTNGKGSVCALLDSMARCAGLRTVMLTKPHLLSWTERIALDGQPISEQGFADVITAVLEAATGMVGAHGSPTVFEVVTAAGILTAHTAQPDLLICEVGLGGRLDSTNVLDLGVAVITAIAVDHVAELGHDIAGIAAEKAAIIKRGNDVVTGSDDIALDVIRTAAERRGAHSLAAVGTDMPWDGEERGRAGITVDIGEPQLHLFSPLIGGFQRRNLAVAAHTARVLRRRGTSIPEEAIVAGAATVHWPGRMQWIDGSPPLLIDGCHNTEAVAAMVAAAIPLCARRHTVAVFGAMADKELDDMLAALRPLTNEVIFAAPHTGRAAPAEDLAGRWGPGARVAGSVASALHLARQAAGLHGVVVAGGSLYLAGETLQAVRVLTPPGRRRAWP
ncbi:MAG: Mur ligase family protein [Candidatus Dormibacteraeota bacterium]|nr:Mur ligase family protein [Candidatus Dormibacteraeota bacterium]